MVLKTPPAMDYPTLEALVEAVQAHTSAEGYASSNGDQSRASNQASFARWLLTAIVAVMRDDDLEPSRGKQAVSNVAVSSG